MLIAITGASGTIGRPLAADLARDHELVLIDRHGADVTADVQDAGALERAFAGCDTVVHLAGVVTLESDWPANWGRTSMERTASSRRHGARACGA